MSGTFRWHYRRYHTKGFTWM